MQSLFHLFAASSNNIVETTLFGNLQDDGSGCGVYMILNLILEILTYGVAILAVIGITIVGINYLTAKGNEQQTQKAKRRIYEIILGLATYAIMYAGLNFLLPGGHFNPSSSCTTVSDQELAKIKAEEAKAQAAEQAKQTQTNSQTTTNKSTSNETTANKSTETDKSKIKFGQPITTRTEWLQAVDDQADYMKNAKYGAKGYKKKYCDPENPNNFKSIFECSKYAGTCVTYPSTTLQRAGLIPKNTHVYFGKNGKIAGNSRAVKALKSNKNITISYPNKTVKELYRAGKIKKGDIVAYQHKANSFDGHIMIFMGFKNKKPIFNTFGTSGMKTNNAHSDGSRKVTVLISINL